MEKEEKKKNVIAIIRFVIMVLQIVAKFCKNRFPNTKTKTV